MSKPLEQMVATLAARVEALEALLVQREAERIAALPPTAANDALNTFADAVDTWRAPPGLQQEEIKLRRQIRMAVAVVIDRIRGAAAALRGDPDAAKH